MVRGDLIWRPVSRQQQQRSRQPFFARIEKLADQVFFDPDVPRQGIDAISLAPTCFRKPPVVRTSL
jgi:hypothetical protein